MTGNREHVDLRDKYELVDKFSHWDPRNKRITKGLGLVISIILAPPAIFMTIWILLTAGYSTYVGLLFFLLFAPVVFLHEIIHFSFQWLFSKRKPQLGFKWPYPYSALRPNTSISRDQGIICALSPFVLITLVFLIITPFVHPLAQAALIISTYLHAPTCSGDFVFTYRLSRNSKDVRLSVLDFEMVLSRDRQDTQTLQKE